MKKISFTLPYLTLPVSMSDVQHCVAACVIIGVTALVVVYIIRR